jgi:uncharacterized membrane protein YdfJ with MMPL/SSD domain
MATFLYRLGRLAFRRRRQVALLWVAVLAAVFLGALNAGEAPDDSSAMPGTEAQKAFDLIDARFPGTTADGASARIVFIAPDGHKVGEGPNRRAIDKLVTDVADGPRVAAVADPFHGPGVSKDGTTAYATVTYKVTDDDLGKADKQELTDAIARARGSGLTVEAGGSALDSDSGGGVGEMLGIGLAAVVLLITFGSLAAAGLPLITAFVGVSAGTVLTAVLVALTLVPALLGFWPNAVLTRRDRKARKARKGSRRTGEVVELTDKAGNPRMHEADDPRTDQAGDPRTDNAGSRWARLVQRHPVPVLIATVVGLVALALPMTDLQLGMPGDEAKSTSTTERRAYDALAEEFGPGFNGPLTVVVDAKDAPDPKAAVAAISSRSPRSTAGCPMSPDRATPAYIEVPLKMTAIRLPPMPTAPTGFITGAVTRHCLAEDVIVRMPYYCARRFHEGARVVTDRLGETFLRRADGCDVADAAETGSG